MTPAAPRPRHRPHRYFFAAFAGGFVATALGLAALFVSTQAWIGGCAGTGYDDGRFLAYCQNPRFGDYEHGGLYLGFEPVAIEHLRAARVVFMGSSTTQAALSSETLNRYFKARRTPHYLMGFSFGEGAAFARAMVERHDLRPTVAIVDATNRFFNGTESGVAAKVMLDSSQTVFEYRIKALSQRLHRHACNAADSPLAGILCGRLPTIFRSRADGRWHQVDFPQNRLAVTPPPGGSGDPVDPGDRARALAFKAFLEGRGTCLVLMAPPPWNEPIAPLRELARSLGVPFVFNDAAGLTAMDGSHLDQAGAEAWARGFIPQLDRALETLGPRCGTGRTRQRVS